MILKTLVALALLCRAPDVGSSRAEYLAGAIAAASGNDIDRAASLLVTGRHEGGWLSRHERCLSVQLGGWGTFGVASLWEKKLPGATCGPITTQASGALSILWKACRFDRDHSAPGFACYLGASGPNYPEAKERALEYWQMRQVLREKACR